MERYESKFEEDAEKLEEGTNSVNIQTLANKLFSTLEDLGKGVKGENGSDDGKHPDAKTLTPIINNMKKEIKQLSKSKGEVWLRKSI